jgi:hypothetical protein
MKICYTVYIVFAGLEYTLSQAVDARHNVCVWGGGGDYDVVLTVSISDYMTSNGKITGE